MKTADDRTTQRIRWAARIWGGVLVVIALFILIGYAGDWLTAGEGDPYAVEDYPFIENLPPLFSLLSALGLGLAWRWEKAGGAIAVFFQLSTLPILLIHWPIAENFPRYLVAPYGTWLLVTIPGVLFLVSWWRTKKKAS